MKKNKKFNITAECLIFHLSQKLNKREYMSKINFLYFIVVTSLIVVVFISCFSIFFLSPSFKDLVIKNAASESVKVTRHLSEPFQNMDKLTRDLPSDFTETASLAVADFKLMKIKVFAHDGETIYSTSEEDISKINENDYFHNIVAKGEVLTRVAQKNTKSLEGQIVSVDVVETYVPIMHAGSFVGAFEVYFDITANNNDLEDLLFKSNALLLLIAAGLLISILFISFIAKRSFIKQELAEKKTIQQSLSLQEKNSELLIINEEKVKLIDELQGAISEIKTLQGLIPICMYCKKIKNDKGFWDQLEIYIEKHSDADFTHGCCPECYKTQIEKIKKVD